MHDFALEYFLCQEVDLDSVYIEIGMSVRVSLKALFQDVQVHTVMVIIR